MIKEVFYATSNPGKVAEVSKLLTHHGIEVVTPSSLGIEKDVPETGQTLGENAILKIEAYKGLVGNRLMLADDTGLEILGLGGEPGIHVRRWKDGKTRMDDEDIIQYCLDRMKGIPRGKRSAQFKTMLALGIPGQKIEIFEGTLDGLILEHPAVLRVEGFPFESLFFVPEWGRLTGDVAQMPAQEKAHLLNHREKALTKVIQRIKELLI